MRTTAALLALLLATTGCLGLGGDDATTPTGPDANDTAPTQAGQPDAPSTTPLVFPGAERFERTLWANGSFAPHEACNSGVGCVTGDAFQMIEIAGLPDAVPTVLHVALTYDEGTTIFGNPLEVQLFSDTATVYHYATDRPDAGHQTIDATVLGGPLTAEVRYGGATGSTTDVAEVPYTLAIHQRADPTVLPAGVPAALVFAPGDALTLTPSTEGALEGILYGPADDVVAQVGSSGALTLQLPADARAGEHVLVTRTGSPDVRVALAGDAGGLRALPLTFTFGETHPIDHTGPVSWSFDVQGTPLAVGLVELPANDLWVTLAGGTARVDAPGGTVFDGPFGCNVCLSNGGMSDSVVSATADAGLGPGTYTATVAHEEALLLEVAAFTVGYQR